MSRSPEQPNSLNYQVSNPAALEAAVEHRKKQDLEAAAAAAGERRRKPAAAKPEKERDRKRRVEKAIDAPARHRRTKVHYEQNSDDLDVTMQAWEESTARTKGSGGTPPPDEPRRAYKPRSRPDTRKPRGKREAAARAKLEQALLSATTATDVFSVLGQLLLARSRRRYADHLVPTPAALHAVRGQVPADVGTVDGISFTIEEAGLGLYEQTIVQVHARWKRTTRDARQQHPLEPLVAWWQEMQGSPPDQVPTVALIHDGQDHLRTPGLMTIAMLSPMAAVEVDGEPFGSTAPVPMMRRLPAPTVYSDSKQLILLPGPRTLDDAAVDPVLATVSQIDCTNRRSPLRSDVLLLVRLGCAILVSVDLDVDGWARVLRGSLGRVQDAARLRAQKALTAGAVIVWHDNRPYQMVRAITGVNGNVIVHPSAGAGWWQGGRGVVDTWRLSGGLWRRRWAAARQGGHRRMAEGIEAGLAWTPPGRARSRISEALHPFDDRPGSPGHEYYIGWQRVLYLSGEPYPLDNDGSAARVYRNRVADFEDAGYRAKGNAPAPAGDTWEITHRAKGGIFVRASARYVEAVRLSQNQRNFTQVTLDKLLSPEHAAA